jgi:hypothetical protein
MSKTKPHKPGKPCSPTLQVQPKLVHWPIQSHNNVSSIPGDTGVSQKSLLLTIHVTKHVVQPYWGAGLEHVVNSTQAHRCSNHLQNQGPNGRTP